MIDLVIDRTETDVLLGNSKAVSYTHLTLPTNSLV